MNYLRPLIAVSFAILTGGIFGADAKLAVDDGYRGIWYSNEPTRDEYVYKYSGGLATYPQQHAPIAIYRPEVQKTFFVYGGTTARKAGDKQELLHMVSYYDHRTGTVPRPRILLNKATDDAHDNPVLAIDDAGHLWIFSPSHGTTRPSYIHRSREPHSIDQFEQVLVTNYSYPNVWYFPGRGFVLNHTRYAGRKSDGLPAIRRLYTMRSRDGREWTKPELLAAIELGDYQITWAAGNRLAMAFDFHPQPVGLNARANIYYLQSTNLGQTWQNVRGETIALPLTNAQNAALVHDSRAAQTLVYLKDVQFEAGGNPVILYMTSKSHKPGPAGGPHEWHTARWTGAEWQTRPFAASGNNYDHGSLYIGTDGSWRIIAPTEGGPQRHNPGGEMALWSSSDLGAHWTKRRQLTSNSTRNHTYARRPVNAHPDFFAVWADGDGRKPSQSNLYFTDRDGTRVWRLPAVMEGDSAKPEAILP